MSDYSPISTSPPCEIVPFPEPPTTTYFGETVVEICKSIFPTNMKCYFCFNDLQPKMLFMFSCGHRCHGYCAKVECYQKNDKLKCKQCSVNRSKNDIRRLLLLPKWATQIPPERRNVTYVTYYLAVITQ